MLNSHPLCVGLFGTGLEAYGPRLKGLKPRLEGKKKQGLKNGRLSTDGFTLAELLLVMAAIGLLAGLAVVAIGKCKAAALAAKDLSNLRQTSSLILLAAGEHGKIPGKPTPQMNWVLLVREYLPGSFPADGHFPPRKPMDPNHPYLCPSLFTLRPSFNRAIVAHQWAMNTAVAEKSLAAIPHPAQTVMLTTATWLPGGGWGRLEFDPAEGMEPDFPYPARRLSTADGNEADSPHRQTLIAFVDGHAEKVHRQDDAYFPVSTEKKAWVP